jgi:hypothetical protein
LLDGEVRKVREEDLIYPKWILSDCRFPNEAEAVKRRGGLVIRVERPYVYKFDEELNRHTWRDRVVNPTSLWSINGDKTKEEAHSEMINTKTRDAHESETALDNYTGFDHVIINDGSIEDLVEKIRNLNIV